MQQSLWKRLLSYFMELHIESTSSEHNPNLYVVLNNGRYQLCTDNAIYSFSDLYDNFKVAFQKINLDQFEIKEVLVLGLGLASIPVILEKNFEKKYHYTTIEIDEEVNYLASKYVIPSLESNMTMICDDALGWVNRCEEKYDLITMDIFLDDIIPDQFETVEFLNSLKSILRPNGILMYNRLSLHDTDIAKCEQFFKDSFNPIFKDATYIEVRGNWILINRKDILK